MITMYGAPLPSPSRRLPWVRNSADGDQNRSFLRDGRDRPGLLPSDQAAGRGVTVRGSLTDNDVGETVDECFRSYLIVIRRCG